MGGLAPGLLSGRVPGLILALTIRRLPEVPNGREKAREERYIPVSSLLRVPAYVMVLVSGWFITFAGHSYVIWGTAFVHQYKGMGLREAGISLGAIVVVAGIFGVMTGAALADRLARAFAWGRVLTVSLGFLVSAPLILWALSTPSKALLLATFALGTFFMTWYHGPVTAIIHDLIPARAHSTAMGMYYFFVNLLATIPAGWLIGRIADRYGLLTGMHVGLAAQLAGGACFLSVIYFIRRHGLHHAALAAYRGGESAEEARTMSVRAASALPSAASAVI